MKTKLILIFIFLFSILQSCNDDTGLVLVNVATPKYMTLDALRSSIEITEPVNIIKSGKIYAYKNMILVNDLERGIHIINNSDPKNPKKVAFIKVIANSDMEVRGDYLYVDSLMDLVVFDISDINNIKEVSRLKDVFPVYIPVPFMEDLIVEYGDQGYNASPDNIIIGWDITKERRRIENVNYSNRGMDLVAFAEVASTTTGQGGSLAKFKIVNNYLYAVDSHNINIFNIDNLEKPQQLNAIFAGFDIETIFNRGDHLFLGSMRGMYIYNIETPDSPQFVSEFQHGTACDPVVVDKDHAYITLRAGNACGALDSSLQIVNITDIDNPELIKSYTMDNPYGLGIVNELLFICDGSSGLKVYDKSNVEELKLLDHFENINTYDVIPLEDHLLMIGEDVLYQYTYSEDGIDLLSQFSLN
jgi:hypothetical protein